MMTRYHLISYGIILLLFGLQFLAFDSFVLTETASKVYYEQFERKQQPDLREVNRLFSATTPIAFVRKTVKHPQWLGWPFVSIGAVLVFQSFVMRRQ